MRHLTVSAILLFVVAVCSHAPADYKPREGLRGHNGIFSSLDWNDYEMAMVSSLHASASYPELMTLVKEKLLTSNISLNDRRKIERMLRHLRPPPIFDNFLNERQLEEVRREHGNKNVGGVLRVIAERLQQLPQRLYEQAADYFRKHTPDENNF